MGHDDLHPRETAPRPDIVEIAGRGFDLDDDVVGTRLGHFRIRVLEDFTAAVLIENDRLHRFFLRSKGLQSGYYQAKQAGNSYTFRLHLTRFLGAATFGVLWPNAVDLGRVIRSECPSRNGAKARDFSLRARVRLGAGFGTRLN